MEVGPLRLFLPVISSLAFSLVLTRLWILFCQKKGFLVSDYYKLHKPLIPTAGGVPIAFTVLLITFLLLAVGKSEFYNSVTVTTASVLTIGFFGVFGFLDDIIDIGRPIKIILPPLFTVPLILVMSPEVVLPFEITLTGTIALLTIPIYIMVTANLTNMHSGFNGLASGLSTIIIGFLLIKGVWEGAENILFLSVVFGATLGFWWFEKYPSRAFLGNSGSMIAGSSIGVAITTTGFFVAGFIMLIPHTINFLLYVYWRIRRRVSPEDERWKAVKFGSVKKDGTIEAPNPLTLKWIPPYYFRVKEWQSVLCMYLLTALFSFFGLFVQY